MSRIIDILLKILKKLDDIHKILMELAKEVQMDKQNNSEVEGR